MLNNNIQSAFITIYIYIVIREIGMWLNKTKHSLSFLWNWYVKHGP